MTDGQFQCQHVSNVVWACAKLNMNDDAELIDVLVRASDAYSTKFNSQELSMVLWGFATLAVSDHKIMHTLAKSMARKVDESSAQQMATAHALAKIGVYNSRWLRIKNVLGAPGRIPAARHCIFSLVVRQAEHQSTRAV